MATTRCSFCVDLIGGVHDTSSSTRYRHMQCWIERQNLNPILPRPHRAIAPDVATLLAELNEEERAERELELDENEGNTWEGDDLENLLDEIKATILVLMKLAISTLPLAIAEASKKHLTFLRLAEWADRACSREEYNDLRVIIEHGYGNTLPSLRRRDRQLIRITGLEPEDIDCCLNSCMAYTGSHRDLDSCLLCNHPRYRPFSENGDGPQGGCPFEPYRTFMYIPLLPRLRFQYQSVRRAHTSQSYCRPFFNVPITRPHFDIGDWWAGQRYRDLRNNGYFTRPTDIALAIQYDGVQAIKQGNHSTAPVIVVNMNLPPAIQYKAKNILLSLVIPGPEQPQNLDSFLHPLVIELNQLGQGLLCFDNYRKVPFTLRAWPVLVCGDGPAISELIGMKRPGNSKLPCRFCEFRATAAANGHYYCPHTGEELDGKLRMRRNLRSTIRLSVEAGNQEDYGINRATVLLQLQSLNFPTSFPIDIMHCILFNIMKHLWFTWKGDHLNADRDNLPGRRREYISTPAVRRQMDRSLARSYGDLPTANGPAASAIGQLNSFKAAQWQSFLESYGIDWMYERIPDYCHQNLIDLYEIWVMCTKESISVTELQYLDQKCKDFVSKYEEIYYNGEEERLQSCTVNHHWILHLPYLIRANGPARYWWSFPLERYVQRVKKVATSHSEIGGSIANKMLRFEQFNHAWLLEGVDPLRRHPDLEDPTVYPELTGYIRYPVLSTQVPRSYLIRLASKIGIQLPNRLPPGDIKYWRRCRQSERLVIGSVVSQTRSLYNRRDYYVAYITTSGPSGCKFGSINTWIEVQGHAFAVIVRFEGVELDRDCHQVSYLGNDGRWDFVRPEEVLGMVGLLTERRIGSRNDLKLIVGAWEYVRDRGVA